MSGGHWNYIQYQFTDVVEELERIIERNGKPKTKEELKDEWRYYTDDWYKKYPEELNHHEYPKEVIDAFKAAITSVKIAQVYVQRCDWLLSGDDGEDDFIRRLNKELKELK